MSAKRLPVVVVFCLLLAVVVGPASPAPTRAVAQHAAAQSNAPESAAALAARYGQLPLLFVENRGQTDPQVAFTLQAGAATVYFTPTGVTYALVEPRPADVQSTLGRRLPARCGGRATRPGAAAALGGQAGLRGRRPGRPAGGGGACRGGGLLLPRPAR